MRWFGRRKSTQRGAKYDAPFFKCEVCEGVGSWRPGWGPEPRPMTFDYTTGTSIRGDSTTSDPRNGDWIHCGDCHGTGWTTRGLRCGRRGDAKAGRNWGRCGRCETVWAFVEGHSTPYSESSGCFPLCEACWSELTINQRFPYYNALWQQWNDDPKYAPSPEKWEAIRDAVLAGK